MLRIDAAYLLQADDSGNQYAILTGEAHRTHPERGVDPDPLQLSLVLVIDVLLGMRLSSRWRQLEGDEAPKHVGHLQRRIKYVRPARSNPILDFAEECDVQLLDYHVIAIAGGTLPCPDGSRYPIFEVQGKIGDKLFGVQLGADQVLKMGNHLVANDNIFLHSNSLVYKKLMAMHPQGQAKRPWFLRWREWLVRGGKA